MVRLQRLALTVFCVVLSTVSAKYVKEMQVMPGAGHKNPGQLGGSFSYKNCNTTAVPVYVKALSVTPDIVVLGKMILLTAEVEVREDIGSISHADEGDFDIKMKIGDQFKDLCPLIGDENCHIKDICSKLTGLAKECPEIIEKMGSNCECPFKKNTYKVTNLPVQLPTAPLEVSGSFDVTVHLVEKGKEMMCLDVRLCIESC